MSCDYYCEADAVDAGKKHSRRRRRRRVCVVRVVALLLQLFLGCWGMIFP